MACALCDYLRQTVYFKQKFTQMKRNLAFLCLLWIASTGLLHAQLSPYHSYQSLYDDAVELFDKQKFGAAISSAGAFLAEERNLRNQSNNDLHVNARYIQAISAIRLDRPEALALMEAFLREFSDNTKASLVRYNLGNYFFDKKTYKKAIIPYLDAWQAGNLPQELGNETVYKLAYSYFMEKNLSQATRFFELAASQSNPFQEDARYYRSVILYQEKNYEDAYLAFQELKSSTKYGKEIKVYLANTLFELKRYPELYTLADELVAEPKLEGKESQVYYIVANAGFERSDYSRTTEYFDRYLKARGQMKRNDYFRYGFAQYKLGEFRPAAGNLERAVGQADTLSQAASYYLGFCYLQLKDELSAKTAFQKASQSVRGGNRAIEEDALFQYGKVCFATESYSDALTGLTAFTEKYPKSPNIEEVQAMIGETYLFSRDYARSIRYFESVPRSSARVKKAYQLVCFYYGLELYEKPDYDRANSYLSKAVDNPFDPDMALSARYWTGESLFRKGDIKSARSVWDSYLKAPGATANEYYARASYGLGWTYFKEKSYSQANRSFDEYIARAGASEPKNYLVDAYLRAGDCAFVQKSYAKANTYYNKAAAQGFAYQDYAEYQQAEALLRQRQYEQAAAIFDRLIRTYKNSEYRDNALDKISDVYASNLGNNDKAAQYAQTLVTDYPKSPLAADAYNRLALVAYNKGNTAQAITYFKKVLSDYGRDERNSKIALDNLAGLLSEAEFDRVLRDYRSSSPETNNNLAELVFNTGKDRFYAGNYTSAIEQFSSYIKDYKNGPDFFEALVFRARSFRETKQFQKALADFQAVYSTTSTNAFTAVAQQEAAEVKFELKDFNGSLALYQDLLNTAGRTENQVIALFGIANNQKALGRFDRAIDALIQIAENNEAEEYSRTQALVEVGQCQYLDGKPDDALATFKQVENDSKNIFGAQSQYMIAQINYDQGKALKNRGNTAQAQAKFTAVRDAAVYFSNTYPSFNYEKAQTFLVAADAYYEMGNVFQAKGTLESLAAEERFPDIQKKARERLDKIIAAEGGSN
ncbi:MAG: hypothetical protein EAZ89_18490 [Bacteroidetes bacterium]|nr:MAG: hypothetical protein EAZ89_18490 [Bacteroidota bacterium]